MLHTKILLSLGNTLKFSWRLAVSYPIVESQFLTRVQDVVNIVRRLLEPTFEGSSIRKLIEDCKVYCRDSFMNTASLKKSL